MIKSTFLSKLKINKKLKLVEPSDEICTSYLKKADKCMLSAKILFENKLYENSVSESYYAMYNSLTALLFKTGIKCENHAGSIMLLELVFSRKDLSDKISESKKERIDKQYYVTSEEDFVLTRESSNEMLRTAEDFLLEIKLFIERMNISDTHKFRDKFSRLFAV